MSITLKLVQEAHEAYEIADQAHNRWQIARELHLWTRPFKAERVEYPELEADYNTKRRHAIECQERLEAFGATIQP